MQSDWTQTTWGQLASLEYGKAIRGYQDVVAPFPVYGTNGPVGWHTEPLCDRPGVIIGRKGAYRGVHYSRKPFFVIDTAFYLKPKVTLDARWAYYQLLTANINGMDSGSAIPSTSRDEFYKLPVTLPPIGEQVRIADSLMLLDNRIDLLRQTNATLESIAQALFKSWFIDFDPVRAKAEGREAEGMDAATAALFPAEFEDSMLGPIPSGWRHGVVEELFVLQRGFDLPATQRTDGAYTVFAASGPHGTHAEAMAQGPGVVTGRSGVIGKVFFAHDDYWPLNTALWVKEFKRATPAYAFQLLQTMDLMRLNAGSAVPSLNRNHVHAQPAVIPPESLVSAFTDMAMALLQRIRANDEHGNQLRALRDTLLPRLISGKLRLPEAQAQLEDALA